MTTDDTPRATAGTDIRITAIALASCLGRGRAVHAEALREGRSGLAPCTYPDLPFDCFAGAVPGLEDEQLPEHLIDWDNRANRISLAALRSDGFESALSSACARHGADRVGLVVGTSTSGVERLESLWRAREGDAPLPESYEVRRHNDHHGTALFAQAALGLEGPGWTISTACSSSAKALIDAVQLVESGLCDAAVAGGVDSLCLISLNGFEALQLVSREPSRPCDADRDGLSIGEGAAFLLVERGATSGVRLSGYGESSDAVSMSTPPEDGAGAAVAMRAALARAGLAPEDIGYVNLHGTATPSNDAAECAAVSAAVGNAVPASSLKGMIGHTLGAAGALEAALCVIALEEGIVPGNVGLTRLDPRIACNVPAASASAPIRHAMSNAFGFGGNNCALVLSR